jgi:hypothetical protein
MTSQFDGYSLELNAFDLHKIESLLDKENFLVKRQTEMTFKVIIRRIEDCVAIESLLGWH